MSKPKGPTPVMKQFWEAKKKHPDAVMLFRMGDFYETFEEDAVITAEILGITLTKRSNGAASTVPLAGFPYHALDQHLYKLLKAGHRVAICEQIEDPKLAKGIVKREVVEVLSPGTAITDRYLDEKENNYLCAVVLQKNHCGIAILDNSTGEFKACEKPISKLSTFLSQFNVTEIIIAEDQEADLHIILKEDSVFTTKIPDWCRNYDTALDSLTDHFKVNSLKGFGIDTLSLAVSAAGSALYYVHQNFKGKIKHITSLSHLQEKGVMGVDAFTFRNLEIFNSLSTQGIHGTLIGTIDNTITASGSRMLKSWLRQPLNNKVKLNNRLNCITECMDALFPLAEVREKLKETSDLERILARVANGKAHPKDVVNLGVTLSILASFKEIIPNQLKQLRRVLNELQDLSDAIAKIQAHIKKEPPVNISKGGYIQDGLSEELDELRNMSADASQWMRDMQIEEQKKTGISSLKVGYNRVFGYYLEVTKTHIDKIPSHYIRKQTLTNSERYFTEDLKNYEEKILSAEEKIIALEAKIFNEVCHAVIQEGHAIQINAGIMATLDITAAQAVLAQEKNYNRPEINTDSLISIKNGRHPVVEDLLPIGEDFIPNDVTLDNASSQIAIITGPNMAGKSTYLRQIGLITIMAQAGLFVPAETAVIGLVDQLFTRVGASDNLAGGESTFLVEMNETANILNNATRQSLILLDEIGRGTSTYDGLSIAWAVTEYLHSHKDVQAKTIFATHYHELVDLAEKLPRAVNLNVAVKEFGDKIIFLKKIIPGGADKSYGVHVAEMAGLPGTVIQRAKKLLQEHSCGEKEYLPQAELDLQPQLDIFSEKEKALQDELSTINVDELTPIEALSKIDELKKKHGL
ncbi:MAG: DNA mismatch repair protein MutS [Candidatus Marinimicrobia bacterium]|nr:DNA mismatch repair protein MutS [Candidatus Neomarinimicrobiota bacterium]MDP6936006.1 DNA mismatch repair protein MutS [Candidatus Neomarinimicrobiota bacterium]